MWNWKVRQKEAEALLAKKRAGETEAERQLPEERRGLSLGRLIRHMIRLLPCFKDKPPS